MCENFLRNENCVRAITFFCRTCVKDICKNCVTIYHQNHLTLNYNANDITINNALANKKEIIDGSTSQDSTKETGETSQYNELILSLESTYKKKENEIEENSKNKLALLYHMILSFYEFLKTMESNVDDEKKLLINLCKELYSKDKFYIETESISKYIQ